MYLQSNERSTASSAQSDNSGSGFIDGFCHAFEQPLDGIAQLRGEQRTDRFAVDAKATGLQYWSQEAGQLCGNAALYMGTIAVASHIPGIGRVAPVAAGAALGFVDPINSNEGTGTRLANAAIGASTMSIMEFGPGLLGKSATETFGVGLRNAAITNGAAGLFSVQADSFLHQGHAASLAESALGVATWAGTGMAFRAVGEPFRAKPTDVETLAPVTEIPAPPFSTGSQTVHVTSDGVIRPYDLYVPSGYNADKPMPMMVMLHGVSLDPFSKRSLAAESAMSDKAEAEGFAVAFGYARDTKKILGSKVYGWNVEGTGLTRTVAGYDDTNYLDKIMADVRSKLNIDPRRIYGVGFSEGGMILNAYHVRHPGVLAGIASVSGTMNGREPLFVPSGDRLPPTDVFVLMGGNDHFLPMNGGRGLMTTFVPKVRFSQPTLQSKFWNAVNDADLGVVTADTPIYRQTDWTGPSGGRVREVIVNDGNHAWHGAPHRGFPIIGRSLPPDVYSTTASIWDFLKDSRLRGQALMVPSEQTISAAAG
jgi:polyhydroxybutyrate depolymerase